MDKKENLNLKSEEVLWNPFHRTSKNSTVVNINRNYKYINIQTSYNLKSEEVQIEEGLTATPYEPYHSPKLYPINLNGNSLAKVGDVKDLLKIYRNGDVEILNKIKHIASYNGETIETVEIKANYLEKAQSIIKEEFKIDTENEDDHINITLPADKLPQVIKELAVADVEIKAVIPKEHTLEEIFFDATKGGKNE